MAMQLPLDNRKNKISRNVWAKFAKIATYTATYSLKADTSQIKVSISHSVTYFIQINLATKYL